MAGLVAEMMTLIAWGMTTFSIAGEIICEEKQKILFGRMDQERRIKILYLVESIKDTDRKMLEEIRKIRNKYTHSWDIDSKQDKGNAKKVVRNVLILFKNISGIDLYIDDSKKQQFKINPKFLNFIKPNNPSHTD